MPNVQPQRLASLAKSLELQTALRAQDVHNTAIAQALNKALVLGDSVQVSTPFTAASPLVVPSDWQTIGWATHWTDTGGYTSRYRLDESGVVWFEINVTADGSATGSDTPFTFASTYFPGQQINGVAVNTTAASTGFRWFINATGQFGIRTCGTAFAAGAYQACASFTTASRAPYVPTCFPFDVLWQNPGLPTVVLAQCLDAASSSPSNLSLSLPDWTTTNKGGQTLIHIRNLPGLLPGKSYSVTVLAF